MANRIGKMVIATLISGVSAAPTAAAPVVIAQCDRTPFASLSTDGPKATSAMASHRKLRVPVRLPFPIGTRRVAIFVSGGHHTSVSFSLIAVRDRRRAWSVDGARVEGPRLLAIPEKHSHFIEALTRDEGKRLEALLSDRCFYEEPAATYDPDGGVGVATTTLETDFSKMHRIATAQGRFAGVGGKIVELIYGVANRASAKK